MWDLDDITPESEAVQAEREIVEEIVKNDLHDRLHAEARQQAERDTAAYVAERDFTPAAQDQRVSFKRLHNGAWGITGPAALLVDDSLVAVTKRDGTTSTVRVGRVLWSGEGKAICTTRRA